MVVVVSPAAAVVVVSPATVVLVVVWPVSGSSRVEPPSAAPRAARLLPDGGSGMSASASPKKIVMPAPFSESRPVVEVAGGHLGHRGFVGDVLPVRHAQHGVVDALALRLALLDGLAEVHELGVGQRDVEAAVVRWRPR